MTSYWILQSNPVLFRIDDALAALEEDDWEIRQYTRHVHVGDRVYIWRAGDRAGIVARGVIIEEPSVRPASIGTEYWIEPAHGERLEHRALVHYDRKIRPPILRSDLRYHPALASLSILRRPLGTVFPVTGEEASAIEEIIELSTEIEARRRMTERYQETGACSSS